MSWRSRLVECDAGYVTPCLEWPGARNDHGYGQVRINGRVTYVHRAVWTEANGDPGDLDVLHRCDNPPCGRLDHLFVGTPAQNMADMLVKGRGNHARGVRNGRSRLSESDVRTIRALYITGTETHVTLAGRFGVSPATVQAVLERRTWKHLR